MKKFIAALFCLVLATQAHAQGTFPGINPIFGLAGTAVNGVQISGAATGNAPSITATGSDTNINMVLGSQGHGNFVVAAGANGNIFTVTSPASASNNNFIGITGSLTTVAPILAPFGGDTNIGLVINSKGTGSLFLQTNSNTAVTVDQNRHVSFATSAPTASACAGFALGTGSSDSAGRVTFTSATSCAISFGTAFTNAPFCEVTPGSAASTVTITTSTTVLTATFGTANTAMFYHCFGT